VKLCIAGKEERGGVQRVGDVQKIEGGGGGACAACTSTLHPARKPFPPVLRSSECGRVRVEVNVRMRTWTRVRKDPCVCTVWR
jgi:hypothetical protein